MSYLRLLLLLTVTTLPLWLMPSTIGTAQTQDSQTTERLVVFEAFMRSTWGISQAAGPAVDRLAEEFANQPIIFLEYNVDAPNTRASRWWASNEEDFVLLPLISINSGHSISNGSVDFYNEYRQMVIEELARPVFVDMSAEYSHDGDALFFSVELYNRTGETLPFVTAHAVLYEEAHIGLTGRFVHASVSKNMGNIEARQTGRAVFSTTDMNNFEAPNMHLLVMVDYQPPNGSGYDMLQATVPERAELTIQTENLTYLIDPESGGQTRRLINMTGPPHYRWEIGAFPTWVYPDVSYGTFIDPPALNVIPDQLQLGWQQDKVTVTVFDNDTIVLQQDIVVTAYLGSLSKVYLPLLITHSN